MPFAIQVGTYFGKDLVRVAAVRPASKVRKACPYRGCTITVLLSVLELLVATASIGLGWRSDLAL